MNGYDSAEVLRCTYAVGASRFQVWESAGELHMRLLLLVGGV